LEPLLTTLGERRKRGRKFKAVVRDVKSKMLQRGGPRHPWTYQHKKRSGEKWKKGGDQEVALEAQGEILRGGGIRSNALRVLNRGKNRFRQHHPERQYTKTENK